MYSLAMAWKWPVYRRTRDQWEAIHRRGHLRHVAFSLFAWIGGYILVRVVHITLFKRGWISSAGLTTWSDAFFYAALPAIISAELDWGDMKRTFSLAPGEDRTMV